MRASALLGWLIFCGCPTPSEPDAGPPPPTCAIARFDAGVPPILDAGGPRWVLEPSGITAAQVAVVINGRDPLSVASGNDYLARRGIPSSNRVTLDFPISAVMTAADFRAARQQLDQQLPPGIEALVLAWTWPYRVDCMSAVTAFAIDYLPERYCGSRETCQTTAEVATFDSPSHRPFEDFGIRPTMMLPGVGLCDAFTLTDRGLASDDTFPTGNVYLVETSDADRNTRNPAFRATTALWADAGLAVIDVDGKSPSRPEIIRDRSGVLGYQTGLASVGAITTNRYLPGAVADHLTSYGGTIPGSLQMSALRWLEAGVTASYGTVIEPCNFPDKFPDAAVLWDHYYRGEPIIEAYWKSVRTPGEGNFIGEPLARPFGAQPTSWDPATQRLTLTTTALVPGVVYAIEAAPSESGPWTQIQSGISVPNHRRVTLEVQPADADCYRLR